MRHFLLPVQGARCLERISHWNRRPFQASCRVQQSSVPVDNASDISHSHFISTASPSSDFNPAQQPTVGTEEVHSDLSGWKGRLSPTTTHLFKLILPLPTSPSWPSTSRHKIKSKPTAFLLHPSQPLSHLSRLITGSLPVSNRTTQITYMALTGNESDLDSHLRHAEEEGQDLSSSKTSPPETKRQEGGPLLSERQKGEGRFQEVAWSESTDLADFIKQSCLNEKFTITICPETSESKIDGAKDGELEIEVSIPTFASRTVYLRKRLLALTKDLDKMTKEKKQIDYVAHKGAQRLAVLALGAGVVYWGSVIRWTFFTEAGWDVMEPVTWSFGFGTLLASAAFLIYHNREVSYSSLLDLSVSSRQKSLYDKHGLDIERWTEMVTEAKTLRREMVRIAADYDLEWKGELENLKDRRVPVQEQTHQSETRSSKNEKDDAEDEQLDIDATIDEADELASQTEERRVKDKLRQRKGELPEVPDEGESREAGGTRKESKK